MFEDKLIERYEVNRKALDDAMNLFKSMIYNEFSISGDDNSKAAISAILLFFKINKSFVPDNLKTWNDVKEFLRSERIFCHKAKLEGQWWKSAAGPMLAKDSKGELIALIPSVSGYRRYYPETGKKKKVTSGNTADLKPEALNFFRSIPAGKVSMKEFLKFGAASVPKLNYMLIFLCCCISTLLSLLVYNTTSMQIYNNFGNTVIFFVLRLSKLNTPQKNGIFARTSFDLSIQTTVNVPINVMG